MKQPPLFLLCVAWVVLLSGCQSRNALFGSADSTKYTIENTEKFARLDAATQAAIICTGLQEHFDVVGQLEVVANIKNRTSGSIQVRVRCVFKDANGFALGDETAWQTLTLGDEATEVVRFTADNKLARKYTIVVRSS
ncbi:MAG TPA: YcfL family protein [Lacunisphaera sp.]|jgi:hypothetical protein